MTDTYADFTQRRRAYSLLLLVLIAAGCDSRPKAPALQDGPVFKEPREGFRFLVPEGWKQLARGQVPPGKIPGERMLAEYKCLTCSRPGALMVSVADVPLSTSLSDYLTKNTRTGEDWKLSGPAEEFTINGVPAARITYLLRAGKQEAIREIVAFRRGERAYFFKGYYAGSDAASRQAIRTAVDTIVW